MRAIQMVGCADANLAVPIGVGQSAVEFAGWKLTPGAPLELAMQIKVSIASSRCIAESDALPLLTLVVDAQPSIVTLGLGFADARAFLTPVQAHFVTLQVELMSTSQRRCDGCGLNRAIKDYHDIHYR